MSEMNESGRDRSNNEQFDQPSNDRDSPQEEILESMLERTKHYLDKDSVHQSLTDYVRDHRLPSQWGFENLCELVRCVLAKTAIEKLPVDLEECVSWIATCIYEDPLANERAERLWSSIITRLQS